MNEHYSPWAWAGWQAGSLPPEMERGMREHLQAGCEVCVREHGFWALLRSTLWHDREPVPQAWLTRALAQCRTGVATPAVEAVSDAGGRARLAFDNFVAPQPRAVRGLQARRHCVYELHAEAGAAAGSLEIMTERLGRSQSAGGDWSIVGQVLTDGGEGWRDCVLELMPVTAMPGAAATRVRSNAAGEFSFVQAGNGPWRLDVQAGHQHWGVAPVLMP